MPIRITCPACEASAKVPDKYAGRRVKCKSCGQALTVPEAKDTGYGDTFSPDALPATGTRSNESGREAVSWETFRIGSMVANWAGILGALGTLFLAIAVFGPMTIAENPAALGREGGTMILVLIMVLAMLGGLAMIFQIGFVVAAASVARGADVTSPHRKWIGAAAMLLRISVLVLILIPTMTITAMGNENGPLMLLGVATVSTLTYFIGYAALAAGIGGVVGEQLDGSGVRQSAIWFGLFEAAVCGWFLVQTFLLNGGMPLGAAFARGFAGGPDGALVTMAVWTVLMLVHFLWFRTIAAQGVKAIADHQESLVGE